MSMLGTFNSPCCATKAAETGTLVHFCRDMVKKYAHRLGADGRPVLEIGEALFQARHMMRSGPKVFSAAAAQQFVDHLSRAFILRERAGVAWAPKWHLMLHMAHQAYHKGNPHVYTTFLDESFNGKVALLAAGCHKCTWHHRFLAHFRWAYSTGKSVDTISKRHRST